MRISRYLFRDIVTFAGILLAAVLVLAWWALGRALDSQAWARAEEATARLTVELDRETRDVSRLGEALAAWWRAGAYDLEAPERLEALALPVLSRQRFVSSINFCRADGTSVLLLRTGGAWHTRTLLPGGAGSRQRWTRRSAEGGPSVVEPWTPTAYDPRARDWYRLVADGAEARWSPDAYRFMTTKDPGLTLSLPVREGGRLLGVIALDVLLDDLTSRVWAAQPTPGTQVVVADERGRALILPSRPPYQDREARFRDFLRPVGPELLPELAELVADIGSVPAEGRQVRTSARQQDAYGLVTPYRGPSGLTWYVMVAIPEVEIMGASRAKGLGILALALLGFAFLSWRAWAIARRFGGPLDSLARSTARPGAGQEPARAPGDTEPPWEAAALQDALGLASRAAEEQLALREQLRSSQRRELVGTLAGGAVHDVNNQLTVALGQIDLCLDALGGDHPVARELELARHALLHGAGVNKALLAFARSSPATPPRAVDLNQLCEGVALLVGRLLGGRIALQLELATGLPPAAGVPLQLEQALVNLVINARDAMPAGGTLTLRTGPGPDGQVRLSVQDTGSGMSPEVQARIFEPYFTTKPAGQGTGLGLATVLGIVRGHGGQVSVESAEGAGTTFTLDLPAFLGPAPRASAVAAAEAQVSLRGRRVLVADDEPTLLRTLEEQLVRAGATVAAAADGAEAAALWEARGPFDAVVSDLEMPRAGGLELYRDVRSRRPDAPFLLVSGVALDAAAAELGPDPRAATLAKPYQAAELLRALARLLGEG